MSNTFLKNKFCVMTRELESPFLVIPRRKGRAVPTRQRRQGVHGGAGEQTNNLNPSSFIEQPG
jgi:hypothetical protein